MQANKRRHPKAKPRKRFWSFIRKLVLWCLVMAAIGAAVGYFGFMMAWKRYDNWAAEFDLERINDLEKPSIIYDRNGEEIGRIYVENRSYVTLDKISPAMINALIAQEDSRFREHPGYDFLGILRAGREYIHNSGDANQGASSITQQLARNAYDLKNRAKARNEGSFGRKFVEIALARRITERYSKDQVLEFYLNRVYFGSGFYGIRAGRLKLQRKRPEIRNTRLFRHLPPVFRTLPRTPLRIHRSHQRKRRTNGPFPFTGPPLRAPINPRQKSVKGKRETPLRPLPRHAAPPWPRKSRNTALPPRIPCAVNAGPPGIYGFLSRDWFFPFWACSCSCAGGIWKRKTPNF